MLVSLSLAGVGALAALLGLQRHAARIGLIAHPHGHCTHDTPTPVVGGIGMLTGLWLAWIVTGVAARSPSIVLGATALVALGAWDDRYGMRARTKFLAQAAIVAAALGSGGLVLHTFGELLPGLELRVPDFALPVTVFATLGLINGVNMLDGLDGLAGKVTGVAFAWLAAAMWLVGDAPRMVGALTLVCVIAAFLVFNARLPGRARALMFMGDAGSMMLGFMLACGAISTSQRAGLPPIAALWICALPILDTLAVMIERALGGRPVMGAARDHLHHLLCARGMRVGAIGLTEAAFGALLGLVGVAGWRLGIADWIMFTLFVVTGLAYHQAFRIAWQATRVRATEALA